MVTALNALIECFVTGLFTAGILYGLAYLGYMPMIMVAPMNPEEEAEENE